MTKHASDPASTAAFAPFVILVALLAALIDQPSVAGTPPGGQAAPVAHGRDPSSAGGRYWGGGVYRPVHGVRYRYGYRPAYWPGYGAWWYGYPSYGFGVGLGLGYGAGWALGSWYYPGYYSAYYPSYYPGYFPGYYPGYYGTWSTYEVGPYGYSAPWLPPLSGSDELVYVQQPPAAASKQGSSNGSWYYCVEPAGYHPYVQRCSRPWIAVQPRNPPTVP